MIAKLIKEKGILTKLFEKGIKFIVIKECKKIRNLKIDIISTSTQIFKGVIQKINISAEDINYKDLFFDELQIEADNLKINFKLTTKELKFTNDPLIKFKISLTQSSLRTILLSKNWHWIGDKISKEILNQEKLIDIKKINYKNDYKVKSPNKSSSSFMLTNEWQPSAEANEILDMTDITKDFYKTKLKEFKIYWCERGQKKNNWN